MSGRGFQGGMVRWAGDRGGVRGFGSRNERGAAQGGLLGAEGDSDVAAEFGIQGAGGSHK